MLDLLKSNSAIWDMYTSSGEYHNQIHDRYDRTPYFLSGNLNVMEPAVSEYLIENGYKIKYPNGHDFSIFLSHDVDILRRSVPRNGLIFAENILKGKLKESFRALKRTLSKKNNEYWNFKDIMDIERKYGAKSTFFTMALKKGEADFNYSPSDLKDEISNITENGWEIGLHGGFDAYNDYNILIREKKRLEKVMMNPVLGYRNHFLKFRIPNTWNILKEAGFVYDSTFGHSYPVGFRNGLCHPFRPYDLKNNSTINLIEIPMALMDRTLIGRIGLDKENMSLLIERMLETVRKYHGVLVVNWHNTSFPEGYSDIYENILKYGREKNAWMTSGIEIARWWKKTQKL